jgi:membrane protease YdiL (CAAX protease family)
MKADGEPGVDVGADLGARIPAALWIALGLFVVGTVFLIGGGLLIAGAVRGDPVSTTEPKGAVMSSTPSITIPAPRALTGREEAVGRYQGIKQYSLAQIIGVWAAAAVPMGILAWIIAPALEDNFSGAGNVPILKALLICLTAGLIWQFVLVVGLVWREQRTLRWPVVKEALWLRTPVSPSTGRRGGWLWLIVIPLILITVVEGAIPTPGHPKSHDLADLANSDAVQNFLSGAWGWYGLILVLFLFNTVLGEELLFRGLLLPRMNGVFGRGDWVANGVLFAGYHLHEPWRAPATLLGDTFAMAYPTKRYGSAWIGIIVHSAQSVFFAIFLLKYVV